MALGALIGSDVARYRELHGRRAVLEQGLWAIIDYRLGHWARHEVAGPLRVPASAVTLVLHKFVQIITGIDINPHARIGGGFHINHFGGICINGDVVMGEHCGISQGVTIGNDEIGTPVIGDHVSIHTGAIVFGAIEIGDHATIAAGAVVFHDVPAHALAVGVPPARVITRQAPD